jgi:hypothetical protein
MDQEQECRQMEIEEEIGIKLNQLYELLKQDDRPESEDWLGTVAELKAEIEGDCETFGDD